MTYETFPPHPDLSAFVKCYWTLTVPADKNAPRQRVLPDGCIELFFILGDDIRRFVSDDAFIVQPREMVLGQITEPYFIQPAGQVHSFAVRFYPYGFANFITLPIQQLANKETPLDRLFGRETSAALTKDIIHARDTTQRIQVMEAFLMDRLNHEATIDQVVKSTVDALLQKQGSTSIHSILDEDLSKRRQLERKFRKQIGISPKKLGKVIRLQAVLKMLLNEQPGHLTNIAYERNYHDQAHFIKDFKEFTGVSPRYFLNDDSMALSSLLYSRD